MQVLTCQLIVYVMYRFLIFGKFSFANRHFERLVGALVTAERAVAGKPAAARSETAKGG